MQGRLPFPRLILIFTPYSTQSEENHHCTIVFACISELFAYHSFARMIPSEAKIRTASNYMLNFHC